MATPTKKNGKTKGKVKQLVDSVKKTFGSPEEELVREQDDLNPEEEFDTLSPEEEQDALDEAEEDDDEIEDDEIDSYDQVEREVEILKFINEKLKLVPIVEDEDKEDEYVINLFSKKIDLVVTYLRSKTVNPTGKLFTYEKGIKYLDIKIP